MQNRDWVIRRLNDIFGLQTRHPGVKIAKSLKREIIAGVILFVCGAAVGTLITPRATDASAAPSETLVLEVKIPPQIMTSKNLDPATLATVNHTPSEGSPTNAEALNEIASEATSALVYQEVRIKRGQGMMDVLVKDGADRTDAYWAIKSLSKHFDMRKLQIGQTLQAAYDTEGRLTGLTMQKDFDHMIRVSRTDDSFAAALEDLPSFKLTRHVQGVIDDSLFLSAYKQGLPDSVIVDMIRIFSFDVDFQREIRQGDRFEILYERKMSEDGRRVEEGQILFAKLTLRGKPISLYRYKSSDGLFADYFHENGKSAKKALMRTPIEGARLSSYFGRRRHPVLGYTRLHKGLDFGAPTGTPIMAAGDGIVERASRWGSFGNYVRIRHNGTYKTAYAHLSKYGRGIKAGKRVKQGQIIGYVGATGRVNGRHLHYEVLVNGKQVNPLRLKIPTGVTLKGEDKTQFLTLAGEVDQQITDLRENILLAWNLEGEGGAGELMDMPLFQLSP